MTTDTDMLETNIKNLERENRELRMTLRDQFAAKAMAALIVARATLDDDCDESFSAASAFGIGFEMSGMRDENGNRVTWGKDLASDAYYMADAMLEARK